LEDRQDNLAWNHSNTSELSFKDSFLFKYGVGQNVPWAKYVWSPDIPPSKSFFVRPLMRISCSEALPYPLCALLAILKLNLPIICFLNALFLFNCGTGWLLFLTLPFLLLHGLTS